MASNTKSLFLRTMRQWHWISSAVCLVGIVLFSITGITLNHASGIEASPTVTTVEKQLPETLLRDYLSVQNKDAESGPIPAPIRQWLEKNHSLHIPPKPAEWYSHELYLSLPRPGGDAWLAIDRNSGEVLYEKTTRGAVAYLNDLHKGRNTGSVWSWFIDIFSAACILFSLTGLVLLWGHCKKRPSTWPLVASGFVLPFLMIILFVH